MKLLLLVLDAFIAAVVAWGVNWLALLPFRRAKDAHWTERARKVYPARVGAALNQWVIPANLALAQFLFWPEASPPWIAIVLAAYAGSLIGTYPLSREIFPQLTFRAWLREVLWTTGAMRAALILFFIFLLFMPSELNRTAWLVAATYATVLAAYICGGLTYWCKLTGTVTAPPERLRAVVAEVSRKMGVPIRGVWLLRSMVAWAVALPWTRELLFSERLLEIHPDDEVAAICGHELGHVNESRATLAARFLGLLIFLPLLFIKPFRYSDADSLWLMATFGTSITILIFSRLLGRHLEVRADSIARKNEGQTGTYARALARFYEANLIPAVMSSRKRIHPDLYDRLIAAGVQPEFPKPEAASSTPWPATLLAWLLGVLVAVAMIQKSL
jgi:Zn-dependent protease with chaperone function